MYNNYMNIHLIPIQPKHNSNTMAEQTQKTNFTRTNAKSRNEFRISRRL